MAIPSRNTPPKRDLFITSVKALTPAEMQAMARHFASLMGKETQNEEILKLARELKNPTDESLLKKIKPSITEQQLANAKRSIIRALHTALPRYRTDNRSKVQALQWHILFCFERGFVNEAIEAHIELWEHLILFQVYDLAPATFTIYREILIHAQEEGYEARLDPGSVILLEEEFNRLSLHSRHELALQSGMDLPGSIQRQFEFLFPPESLDENKQVLPQQLISKETIVSLQTVPAFAPVAAALEIAAKRQEIFSHSTASKEAYKLKQIKTAQIHVQQVISLSEANPAILKDAVSVQRYLRCIKLNAIFNNYLGEKNSYKDAIATFQSLKPKFPAAASSIYSGIQQCKIFIAIISGSKSDLKSASNEYEKNFATYSDRLSHWQCIYIQYYFALMYLYAGMPKIALTFILEIKHQPLSGPSMNYKIFSWLLFLIAHYKLSNFELIEKEIPEIRKILGPLLTEWESEILDALEKAVNAKAKGIKFDFSGLANSLKKLTEQFQFRFHFDYYDFIKNPIG